MKCLGCGKDVLCGEKVINPSGTIKEFKCECGIRTNTLGIDFYLKHEEYRKLYDGAVKDAHYMVINGKVSFYESYYKKLKAVTDKIIRKHYKGVEF